DAEEARHPRHQAVVFDDAVKVEHQRFHRRAPSWARLGGRLGLKSSSTGLRGHFEGWQVELYESKGICVVIYGVDPGFTIGRDSLRQQLAKPDILTGDRVFDERIRIEGDRTLALATLRDYVRRTVESLVLDFDGVVEDDRLVARVSSFFSVEETLPRLVDLATNLRRTGDDEVPRALAQVARHDSLASVRLQALQQLAAAFPQSSSALEAARAVTDADDPALRIEAASLMAHGSAADRRRGVQLLEELVMDGGLQSALRRSALVAFQSDADGTALGQLISRLLAESTSADLRRAAIRVCEQRHMVEPLLGTAAPDEAEWVRRIQALEAIADASAEPALLDALEQGERKVQTAAARALGAFGTLDALPRMAAVADSEEPAAVIARVRQSMATIQQRAGSFQTGEISLSAPDTMEGALSPAASADGGEVSFES
ncbi:MAG: HEAT repeat domain-containing protein, partial [Acidobacteriota bacterium]